MCTWVTSCAIGMGWSVAVRHSNMSQSQWVHSSLSLAGFCLVQTCKSDGVQLLAEDKGMLGVMFLDEAMDVAPGQGMDVVLISLQQANIWCKHADLIECYYWQKTSKCWE